MTDRERIAEALYDVFVSPNVADSNLEPANVVDVIHQCAQALHHIARALEQLKDK